MLCADAIIMRGFQRCVRCVRRICKNVGASERLGGLLVFPLVLVLELTVLRKWCVRFCPMGAVASLLSAPNRLWRPRVDNQKCLRAKGVDCQVCSGVCPEELDPHFSIGMHECSKCRACVENCPAGAISLPFLGGVQKRQEKETRTQA